MLFASISISNGIIWMVHSLYWLNPRQEDRPFETSSSVVSFCFALAAGSIGAFCILMGLETFVEEVAAK